MIKWRKADLWGCRQADATRLLKKAGWGIERVSTRSAATRRGDKGGTRDESVVMTREESVPMREWSGRESAARRDRRGEGETRSESIEATCRSGDETTPPQE